MGELGLRGQQGESKFIPDGYKRGSREQRLALLAGLLDSDGHLVHGRVTFEFVSKSWQLAADVAFVARSLGFAATQHEKVLATGEYAGNKYQRVYISGDVHLIPTIARKRAPERKQKKDVLRTGFEVTPLGEGDYAGFTLDGDGRFLLGDFTVTHNSYVARAVAEALGMTYIDIRALLLDPVDLSGIPYRDGTTTRWAIPEFLPQDPDIKCLINLDELPAAPQSVQTALYQLILDRAVREYKMPKGAYLIACGNRANDRGTFHHMAPALASRMIHFDVKADAAEWCGWAAEHDLAPEVIFYIQFNPDAIHQLNPASSERAFPTPRTWEMVSRYIDSTGTRQDTADQGESGHRSGHHRTGSGIGVHGFPSGMAHVATPAGDSRQPERCGCPRRPLDPAGPLRQPLPPGRRVHHELGCSLREEAPARGGAVSRGLVHPAGREAEDDEGMDQLGCAETLGSEARSLTRAGSRPG